MLMKGEHPNLEKLLKKNIEVAEENNKLLRKMNRMNLYGLIFKFVWFAILIGLPFLIYFYVLEPYFAVFGASFEEFREGVGEIPGIKGIEQLLELQEGLDLQGFEKP